MIPAIAPDDVRRVAFGHLDRNPFEVEIKRVPHHIVHRRCIVTAADGLAVADAEDARLSILQTIPKLGLPTGF